MTPQERVEMFRQWVESKPVGSIDRYILEYIYDEGVGWENAKTYSDISEYLEDMSMDLDRDRVRSLIKESRRNGCFICGSDSEPHKGVWMPIGRADFMIMEHEYEEQLEQLEARANEVVKLREEMTE